MVFTNNLDQSITLTLNLTETLLIGRERDAQHIFCQNIGIVRNISKISYLYSKQKREDSITSEPVFIKAILGSIGSSQIAILPQKINSLLMKGWSYPARLKLLWSVIDRLNEGNSSSKVVCIPDQRKEALLSEGLSNHYTISSLLKPLGLEIESTGNNLLLCNPVYYPLLIVESGLSQQEFSHVERYIGGGGNVIFSVDSPVLENYQEVGRFYDGDQICMNLGLA